MVWRLSAIAAYVGGLLICFAILNADYSDWQGAFAAAAIGGVILGLGNDFWTGAALTLLSPAVAELFGYPEKSVGEPPELWFVGAMLIHSFSPPFWSAPACASSGVPLSRPPRTPPAAPPQPWCP